MKKVAWIEYNREKGGVVLSVLNLSYANEFYKFFQQSSHLLRFYPDIKLDGHTFLVHVPPVEHMEENESYEYFVLAPIRELVNAFNAGVEYMDFSVVDLKGDD